MIKPSQFAGAVTEIASALPPGTIPQFGSLLWNLLRGKPDAAAANARVVAQALAIKSAARAPYRVAKK